MDMKNSREEEILTHLSEMDEELLDTAYSVDSPEKLIEYIKKDAKKKSPFFKSPAFYRRMALAACFIFIIGAAVRNFKLPSSQANGFPPYSTPSYGLPSYGDGNTAPSYVNGISSLNYYCAMAAINESEGTYYSDSLNTDTSPQIYYYKLDPNEKFYVYHAEFFRINVTREDGFLASVVGTGKVDVVITQNSLDDMITFKKGDKYFSCLMNGGNDTTGEMTFSTHKYIEGYNIVKNVEQDNYCFTVSKDGFVCKPFISDGGKADGALEIVGKRRYSDVSMSFTVSELEKYVKEKLE